MKIGLLIRKRREEVGLKQKDLAQAVNKSSAYLNKVEKGETTPTASFLQLVADPLNLDFIELYLQSLEEKELPEELMDEFRSYRTLRPLLQKGMPMEQFYTLIKNLSVKDQRRIILIVETIALMINQSDRPESIKEKP